MAPDDNASVLCFIFQQSLNSGCIPLDWKFTLVNPVHKKGPCSDPGNNRPISLTCISCKLLEHVISSSIMKHLDQSNILSPFQHGFRLRHSCETQLLFTVHDLAKGIDQHLQTDLVLLDFTKAFDSVPNQRLFLKLQHLGINGCTLCWLQDFLSNRSQATVVGGTRSTACHVLSRVPQGSVLGPLLFLLYINNLPDGISSNIRLFADDCLLYIQLQSHESSTQLQSDPNKLSAWSSKWQLCFNPAKCFVMHMSRKRTPLITDYFLYNTCLAVTKTHPYLGVEISDDLRWNSHCTRITN